MFLSDSTFSIPKSKRKPRKSAGTASCSISAQLFWRQQAHTSVKVNAWGRSKLQNIHDCMCGFYICDSQRLKHHPTTLSQQRLANQEPLLVTRYSNFLHRYCGLSFSKLHSLVMNLYDLQYLLLAGAHRWSTSTPDWQYAASNAERGCVTSIKVENRTKISENRINFWERLF